MNRFSYYIAALLLVCPGCSMDTRKFYVSSPSANAAFLAPDLASLTMLLGSGASVPDTAIAVPNGTKGRMLDRKFFKGGQLVEPYPANTFDMERDLAVDVSLFEIIEGPKRGAKGWLRTSLLRPDFWYL